MKCPTVEQLPGVAGRQGWPWTVDGTSAAPTAEGSGLPQVTIVTPSFNQAAFLEATIRSVLLQGYPDLEYVIVDGGSTDGSVDIIRRYEPWLAWWVSEPDHGQSEAINKGFRRATGDVVAWLNSDDVYLPGAMPAAVAALKGSAAGAVYSRCRMVDPEGRLLQMYEPLRTLTLRDLVMYWQTPFACPPQPTVFFRRAVLDRVGLLDETLHYALDYEYWLRAIQHFRFAYVDAVWADYTVHPKSKTGQGWQPFAEEVHVASCRASGSLGLRDRLVCRLAGRRLARSRHEADSAYDAYRDGNWPGVRRHLTRAFALNPSRLMNRGSVRLLIQAWARAMVPGWGLPRPGRSRKNDEASLGADESREWDAQLAAAYASQPETAEELANLDAANAAEPWSEWNPASESGATAQTGDPAR